MILFIFMVIIGLFIYLGSIIGFKLKENKRFINFNNSTILGYLVTSIIFVILPNSIINLNKEVGIIRTLLSIILLLLIGIFILKILDLFVPYHNSNRNSNKLYHIGVLTIMVLFIYNIIYGMHLYLLLKSSKNIIIYLLSIGISNIPFGVMISTLLYPKMNKKKILYLSIFSSLSIFIGSIIMLIIGNVDDLVEGIIFSLICGMILYIVKYELLNITINLKNKRILYTGIVIGSLTVILTFILGCNL